MCAAALMSGSSCSTSHPSRSGIIRLFVWDYQALFYDAVVLTHCCVQVIDSGFDCWCFGVYWFDIVDLALQQAGGKPGPAAVAAAQKLMQEKHSIFIAR